MPDSLILILVILLILIVGGLIISRLNPSQFSWRWLLVGATLLFLNDAALTLGYGLIPNFIGGDWNWTGKILALLITLGVAMHPAMGWRRSGLTLRQNKQGRSVTYSVFALLIGLFACIAFLQPPQDSDVEDLTFQLTMPGLEEESYYRGTLLLALNEAFRGRWRFAGIDWSWGALLSSTLFGLGHAFNFDGGQFGFDPMTMAATAIPALALVWLRERTGSIMLPIIAHNFANSASYFL